MQITNKHNLPEVIVDAVKYDPYDSGRREEHGSKYITTTQLCSPPQLVKLKWKHEHEIVEDVSERIWSLQGQAMHSVIERAAMGKEDYLAEKRLFHEIDGWTVSGQLDLYRFSTSFLWDFKNTSVYSANPNEVIKTSWNRQLNILRWLMHKNGIEVEQAAIVGILRDWSRTKAKFHNKDGKYPMQPVSVVPAIFVSLDRVESFVRSQLAELEKDEPRECTDEERWKRGGNFAVMRGDEIKWAVRKPGASRALKVYDSRKDAEAHAEALGDAVIDKREKEGSRKAVKLFDTYEEAERFVARHAGANFYVEGREAEYLRCESYCSCRDFCRQAQGDAQVM